MNRMTVLFLLVLGAPAFAASPGDPVPFNDAQGRSIDSILIPLQSPVRFSGWLEGNVARFEGRFVLEGTYYYGDSASGSDFVGEAHIVPDRNARFPLLMKRSGARAIKIDNPEIFAQTVIPAGVLQSVRRKGGGYASGHVAIRAEGFTVAIACDRPSYGTHFASVYRPSGSHIENARPNNSGC